MIKNICSVSIFSCLLLLSTPFVFAQNQVKQALTGEWINDEISLADGSTIYDPAIKQSTFLLHFISTDSLMVSYNGINSYHLYTLQDSTLSYAGNNYKILRLEKPILELSQLNSSNDMAPLKIKMVAKPVFDINLNPEYYPAKNGELVYKRVGEWLSPRFINRSTPAMDYIFEHFGFPEYKKGGFIVRFVITKEGKMEGLRIMASSNHKYDQQLINAVKKTKGKWQAATYMGEKVNCEVEYNFNLDYTQENTSNTEEETKFEVAQFTYQGDYYFDAKNYKTAIYYFSKAIEKDAYQVDALYKRAASYVLLKKIDEACADYLQLKTLNQTKGATLYDRYCSKPGE